MSSSDPPTMLDRALGSPDDDADDADADDVTTRRLSTAASSKAHIDGAEYPLADPETSITFEDSGSMLSGQYGRPRPREFWTAKQLGRTPPMELLKNAVARQLTGGEPIAVTDDDELQGPQADFATVVTDIYKGPHFQGKTLDNLMVDAVDDMIDLGWAYWELLPTEGGAFPVGGFKPLPPLQIQHNVDDDTGALLEDPAYYQVPYKRQGGTITTQGSAPTQLDADQVVAMREPLATGSDSLYGESLATKVREWLELIIDVDVHQKRYYSDSQLPAGFLHFVGNIGEDKLQSIEQDLAEASGDPHDLVTAASEDQATWIPMGDGVVDLEAIQEQEWYFGLVFAAAGLNLNELGIIEGSGFAKETPALQRQVYKNVTKPYMSAIFDPQNAHVIPQLADAVGLSEVAFRLTLERFDPVQEQIEREETMTEWSNQAISLNEFRGALGREAETFEMEIDGEMVDLADTPRWVVDLLLKRDRPEVDLGEGGSGNSQSAGEGPPDFEQDPVLSEREAFEALGQAHHPGVVRQLEDTIDIQSSFIVSTAYADPTNFMQIEFEKEGQNAVYWYGNVPKTGAASFFGFLRSASKGRYFNSKIRHTGDPGYPYARVQ